MLERRSGLPEEVELQTVSTAYDMKAVLVPVELNSLSGGDTEACHDETGWLK